MSTLRNTFANPNTVELALEDYAGDTLTVVRELDSVEEGLDLTVTENDIPSTFALTTEDTRTLLSVLVTYLTDIATEDSIED